MIILYSPYLRSYLDVYSCRLCGHRNKSNPVGSRDPFHISTMAVSFVAFDCGHAVIMARETKIDKDNIAAAVRINLGVLKKSHVS